MSDHIIGKLMVAGNYPADEQIGGQPLARAIVVMSSDALKAVKRLPMYKEVAVVELENVTTLERQNAALREALKMAKRYVPPQAVTGEWRTKPVSECRLLDAIDSVLRKEAQP